MNGRKAVIDSLEIQFNDFLGLPVYCLGEGRIQARGSVFGAN